jgi:hypothetical protein
VAISGAPGWRLSPFPPSRMRDDVNRVHRRFRVGAGFLSG